MRSVVVAEVTQPSLGVGYELGRAVDMKKKVFCLFRPSSGRREATSCLGKIKGADMKGFRLICFAVAGLSAMIRGAEDCGSFLVRDYAEDDIERILEEFFSDLKSPKK